MGRKASTFSGLAFSLVFLTALALDAGAVGGPDDFQGLNLARASVVRIQVPTNNQNGFGYIVGYRGDELIAVTANHVVRDQAGFPFSPTVRVYLSDLAPTPEVPLTGSLHAVSLIRTRGDLAFVTFPARAGFFPSWMSLSRDPARTLDPAKYIGRSAQWFIPDQPGRVTGVSDTDFKILTEGLVGVERGSSGGPLFTSGGLVGILTESTSEGAIVTATSIDLVKRLFTQELLQHGWTWGLAERPPRVAGYSVCLAREDEWDDVSVYAVSGAQRRPVFRAETCQLLSAGQYNMQGEPVAMTCIPEGFRVVPSPNPITIKARCVPDLAGTWRTIDGMWRIQRTAVGVLNYTIQRSNSVGTVIGAGTGNLSGHTFTANGSLGDGGMWFAKLEFRSGGLAGELTQDGLPPNFPLALRKD